MLPRAIKLSRAEVSLSREVTDELRRTIRRQEIIEMKSKNTLTIVLIVNSKGIVTVLISKQLQNQLQERQQFIRHTHVHTVVLLYRGFYYLLNKNFKQIILFKS